MLQLISITPNGSGEQRRTSSNKDGKSKTNATELSLGCGLLGIEPSKDSFLRIDRVNESEADRAVLWSSDKDNSRTINAMFDAGAKVRSYLGGISNVSWVGDMRVSGPPRDLIADGHYISAKANSHVVSNSGFRSLLNNVASDHAFEALAPQEMEDFFHSCGGKGSLREWMRSTPTKNQKKFGKEAQDADPEKYRRMVRKTSEEAQILFKNHLNDDTQRDAFFFKMFRIYDEPYFVCGVENNIPFAVSVCTQDEWKERFKIKSWNVRQRFNNQCEVHFDFFIDDLNGKKDIPFSMVMEIRWSHGKFSGNPECKIRKEFEYRDLLWVQQI